MPHRPLACMKREEEPPAPALQSGQRSRGIAAKKIGLLGSLYLSQGLPFGFFTQALPLMMRREGASLGSIGLSSLLAAPWALKFIWAPLVDRFGSEQFGRRRSWIIPLQLLTVACVGVVGLGVSPGQLQALLGAVFVINALAATQDIATDGLAVDLLSASERGLGNGVQVAGYRVGMVIGGGALLIALDAVGWSFTFLMMAALLALATLPVLLLREPTAPGHASKSPKRDAGHFVRRPGAARILCLIVLYKAGEHFATAMLRPFLADAGISLAEIGVLLGTVGFIAGLLGAVLGGALVNKMGRKASLLWFGLLQALTVGGYALLATFPAPILVYTLCAAEHLAGGMATAALFTCMMDWCHPRSAATDYTVQASAVVIASGAAAALSGFSAQATGYARHFLLASALSALAVAAVWKLFPRITFNRGDDMEPLAANQRSAHQAGDPLAKEATC